MTDQKDKIAKLREKYNLRIKKLIKKHKEDIKDIEECHNLEAHAEDYVLDNYFNINLSARDGLVVWELNKRALIEKEDREAGM